MDLRENTPGGRCPSCGKDRDQPSGPFLFSSVAFSYPREGPLKAPWGWGCSPDLWAINLGGQGGHLLWPSDSDCSLAHRIPRLTPHRTPLLGSSDSSFNTPSDSLCSTPSLAPVSLHGQGHRCRTAPVRGLDDMSTCHFRPTLGAYYSGGIQVRHVGGAREADPHGGRYRRRSSTAA